jgi:TPR repeat protein
MAEELSSQTEQAHEHLDKELDAAKVIFRSGDESTAVPLFEKLAEAGSAAAMTWVGYVYLKARGVAVDTIAAHEWFLKATELGDAEAMGWLGNIYFYGHGVPVDFQLARDWYLKGALAGDADAMCRFGQMYFYGSGVDVDKTIAFQWYLKAAEAGDGNAMSRVGSMYSVGDEIPVDTDAARFWYSKSAEAGDAYGQHCYASVLDKAGEHDEAVSWLRKASDQGHDPATKALGEQTAYQFLQEKRYAEAALLLKESGSAWAHEWLGYLYGRGHGVSKDLDMAIAYYEMAYSGGNQAAAIRLGHTNFKQGRPNEAIDWLRKATSKPISSAYWQYRILKNNPHLQRHPGEADELLKQAADAGHVFARRALAMRMIKGDKVLGSRSKGVRAYLAIFLHAIRIVAHDEYDERLQ